MTVIKPSSPGLSAPQGNGRPVLLAVLCTLLFLTFLDNTIVSVGLGSVQADLHAGVLALQWVVRRVTRPMQRAWCAPGGGVPVLVAPC
jgi:hypothetical protein